MTPGSAFTSPTSSNQSPFASRVRLGEKWPELGSLRSVLLKVEIAKVEITRVEITRVEITRVEITRHPRILISNDESSAEACEGFIKSVTGRELTLLHYFLDYMKPVLHSRVKWTIRVEVCDQIVLVCMLFASLCGQALI
jgi:hypothetical protein